MFKKNDWIESEDGICQIIEIQNINENFLFDEKPSKAISYIWYKILFNSSGSLRKSRYFNFLPDIYCRKISSDSLLKINEFKENKKEEFNKFISRKPSNNPIMAIDFSIRSNPSKTKEVVESINNLFYEIEKPFTYEYFIKKFNSKVQNLESGLLPCTVDTLTSNIMVSINYELFDFNSTSIKFINGSACETYSAL